MRLIQSEIRIQATAEKIWKVFTDFENHVSWNPFFESISGDQWVGGKLAVRMKKLDGKAMTFRPTILEYESGSRLVWKGKLLTPLLFSGEHGFAVSENGDGFSTFRQWENFSGILLPIFGQKFLDDTKKSFEEMNEALKEYVETFASRNKRKMTA